MHPLLWPILAALTAMSLGAEVRFVKKSRYLNDAKAVVTHTIDDSTRFIPNALDAMDRYGIKSTVFVSTQREPISELWPRLRQAIAAGHEIGSHSRTHQCKWPDTEEFCRSAYTDSEIFGSRDDILKNTPQPYVWSWCYPCGNCASYKWVHRKLFDAGYVVARNYPGEQQDLHNVPNLTTWDSNPYNAAYTQVVQKKGGIAKSGRTDVDEINAKFDEVHQKGGIYNFLSHPQWLDYGPDSFYERHLKHVGGRADVWYVPMGPLYAYRAVYDKARVRPLGGGRFSVSHTLNKKAYPTSITLEFAAPDDGRLQVVSNGRVLAEKPAGPTARWDDEFFRRDGAVMLVTARPDTTLEFRPVADSDEVFTITRLAIPFATGEKPSCASVSEDGATLVYQSQRVGGRGGHDLWFTPLEGGRWSQPVNAGPGINTASNEVDGKISADGRTLLFVRGEDFSKSSDVYISHYRDGTWTTAELVGPPVSLPGTIEFGASLTRDGKRIYFSSNRPGGHGGFDHYVAEWTGERWGAVTNLGPAVNSAGGEVDLTVSRDGNTIVFPARRSDSMGASADLYGARKVNGVWNAPVNLGPRINTPGSEGCPWLGYDGQTLYLDSDWSGGVAGSKGASAIWKIFYSRGF